jgi:hypothetical protein
MRTKKYIKLLSISIAIALVLFLPCLSVAGNLEPSASPNPTMHTLDEIYRATTIPRFTDNSNGTVTDNHSGLMWTKDADLFSQVGNPYGWQNWSDAINSCKTCSVGGYDNWRLPQIRELMSLIHRAFYNPPLPDTLGTGHWTSGNPFTNVMSEMEMNGYTLTNYYWSSTTAVIYNNDPSYAWVVNMYNGDVLYEPKEDPYPFVSVWCVRGGQ